MTYGLICVILHYLVMGGSFWWLESIYSISFGLKKCTPLLLCIGTLLKLLCLNLQLLSWTFSSGQLEPNYFLFKLCCRKTWDRHRTLHLTAYTTGSWDFQLAHWAFWFSNLAILVQNYAVFVKLTSNCAHTYAEGSFGREYMPSGLEAAYHLKCYVANL